MKTGKRGKKWDLLIGSCLLIISVLIKTASYFPYWLEENYSRGLYQYLASFFRTIFGWIPISLGDLLYAAAGYLIITKMVKFVKVLVKRQARAINLAHSLKNVFFIAVSIYIYFNLTWGLNYNRPGIASQLGLTAKIEDTTELKVETSVLIRKVNESRKVLESQKIHFNSPAAVFEQAANAYHETSATFPFLHYQKPSIKRSLYGKMGNFLGFLGYYNPFTGEAQVNLTQPAFLAPFVSCHEIAHQLGYASESEANFVGYLAATHSSNPVFHYSAYFDLFNYANQELYRSDSSAARYNYRLLDTLVKKDKQELREYRRKSDNMIEPFVKIFYDRYLKANQQSKGMRSYNEVVGWLVAYFKKYGTI